MIAYHGRTYAALTAFGAVSVLAAAISVLAAADTKGSNVPPKGGFYL